MPVEPYDDSTPVIAPQPIAPPAVPPGHTPLSSLITSPEQLPVDTGTQPVDMSGKASAAYSGPTAAGHQRAQGMLGDIDARVAQYDQKDAVTTSNDIANYKAKIAGEKAAIGGVQNTYDEHETALNQIEVKRQALFEEAAKQEAQARADSKISAAQFMSTYQQQLAGVRAMSVNIAGPLAKLSTSEVGGLTLAMFAQGFLAAQGIHIDVGQQIDRWVDRSIAEQTRQITQAGEAAQDTLNLWQISRQNSADDLEARQRYRGFIIEGLKSQTEMQAARFQSRLASAQSGVTRAHLDTEAEMVGNQMGKAHEARVFEQKKWETQTAFELEKVNLEKQKVALEAARVRAMKPPKEPKHQLIIDPSDGKAKWYVSPDRINAQDDAKVATKSQADYERVNKQINEAMDFRQKHISDKWGHSSIIDQMSEAKRQYDAMVDRLAIEMGKTEFGTRASDKEAERIKKLVPFDKWYQKGSNESIWTKYMEDVRSDFTATMRAHTDPIPEDQQVVMYSNEANPSGKAVYDAQVADRPPVAKFEAVEQAKVVGKDSEDVGEHAYGSKIWGHYALSDASPPNAMENGKLTRKVTNYQDRKMPGWAVAVDHLVNGYVKPEETKKFGDSNKIYYGTANETPDEIRDESLKALRNLAKGEAGGKEVPEGAQAYAKYILSLKPDELKDLMDKTPGE